MRMSRNVSGTKGARLVSREAVNLVQVPSATTTWTPVGHGKLLNVVAEQVEKAGLKIVNEEHFLGREGNRYFGRLHVKHTSEALHNPEDYGFFIGLRNSLDKSFAAALGFGTSVFVCSNGCFSAEHILNRKHTQEIMEDLPRLAGVVMARFAANRENVLQRYDAYKHMELSDAGAHDLIIRAAEGGAANYRQVPTIVQQWNTPNHPEFGERRNHWRLFNAFTEAAKLGSEGDLWDRSMKLQALFDESTGFIPPSREIISSETPEVVEAM